MSARHRIDQIARLDAGLLLLAFGMIAAALIRFPMVNQYAGFTSDMGSYLMTRNWVLLDDPTAGMIFHYRPPIVGALLVPFTWGFGDLMGSKVLAILASMTIAPASYALFRNPMPGLYDIEEKRVPSWVAACGALLLMYWSTNADMTAGGYLSLLTLPLLALGVLAINRLRTFIDFWPLFWLIAITVLIVGLNQTIAGWWFVICGAFVVSDIITRQFGRAFVFVVIFAVCWLPAAGWFHFYGLHPPGAAFVVPGNPLFFPRPSWDGMTQMLIISLAFAYTPRRLAPVLVIGLMLALVGMVGSSEIILNNQFGRAASILPIFTVLSLVIAGNEAIKAGHISPVWRYSHRLFFSFALCLIALNVWWLFIFNQTATAIDMLTDDNLAGIEWIEANTDKDARIYTHPNGLGWWVGGLGRRAWSGSWPHEAPPIFRADQIAFDCDTGLNPCLGERLAERGFTHVFVDPSTPFEIYNHVQIMRADKAWYGLWRTPPESVLKPVFVQGDATVYEVVR